jgi:hydroxyacylglutathione hydrolase
MQAKELAKQIKTRKVPCIIDVRSGIEYRAGHIPGALHAPTWKILFRLAPLPKERETLLVLTCEHGPRAQMARSLLGLFGYRTVTLLEGHMAGWRRAGLPVEK